MRDVPTKGAEAARHRTHGLCLALLDFLAGLEGCGPQLFQLLLREVVGHLHSLSLGRRVSQGSPQAWKP
jgi:hypothetical protein